MTRVIPRRYLTLVAVFFVVVIAALFTLLVFQNRQNINDIREETTRARAAERREGDARIIVATIERRKSCENDEANRKANLALLREFGVPDNRIPPLLRTDRDCGLEAREYADTLRNPIG